MSNLNIVADFWSRYEIVYRGGNEEEEPTDDNFDDDSETVKTKLPTYQLKVDLLATTVLSSNNFLDCTLPANNNYLKVFSFFARMTSGLLGKDNTLQ